MTYDGEKTEQHNECVLEPTSQLSQMINHSQAASAFLKALSHEGRLMILFYLAERERSVTELEHCLGSRQSAVSQQLARLRLDGLVKSRRAGKTVIYSISDPRVKRMISIVHDIFVPAN